MKGDIRVIQYGLGPIGCAVARLVVQREGVSLVGAVDIDPDKVGQDVGEVIGLEKTLGFPVVSSLSEVTETADIVAHTTNSYFDQIEGQLQEILQAGYDIVSTSEELSFPWLAHPVEGARVDAWAKQAGVTILGTGVNPGFLMDSLPINLTAICERIDSIAVTRVINASQRRGPFQAKIGSGLSIDEFNTKMAAGRMGHVGLPESIGMLFDTFGKTLTRYEDSVEPLVAGDPIQTDHFSVSAGEVRGLKQVARGYDGNDPFVTLIFIAALDESPDGDKVEISGSPDLTVVMKGTNGDIATAAITVNAIRRVLEAPPGLVTMRDLPIVSAW